MTFIDNETTHDERKELAKMDEGLRNAVKKIEEAAQTEGALRTYYKIQIERMRRENEIEEGIQEGLQKGLQKGRKEGRHEGIVKTAINLKNMGLSTEDIAKATNLTTDFIEEL